MNNDASLISEKHPKKLYKAILGYRDQVEYSNTAPFEDKFR